ncbi:MAG: hypothetical protein ABW171_17395 [Steroidobacter sp.]
MKLIGSLLICFSALLAQATFAAEPLSATLEVSKVIRTEQGKETLVPAESAKPGDVLEYRVIYKNLSDKPLRGLVANLPMPADGVEFLLDSARPSAVEATRDGAKFGPIPLKRRVAMPDGNYQEQLVPAVEYRTLRWPLGDLPAGGSKAVSARVRISESTPTR